MIASHVAVKGFDGAHAEEGLVAASVDGRTQLNQSNEPDVCGYRR